MEKRLRLDKFLADLSVGTRSEVKRQIRSGRVLVNGEVITASDFKVEPESDAVSFDGKVLAYCTYEYYLLNKPAGIISASNDKKAKTVVDLIESALRKDLFPVGRLDKDTEGLLIITNDGTFAHQMLSPKKHVDKVYYAIVSGEVTKEDAECFSKGIQVDDEFRAMPAQLRILKTGFSYEEEENCSEIELTIQEGKFHQVKRMFSAVNKEVLYLKRVAMGSIKLPEELAPGEYRRLTGEELRQLGILDEAGGEVANM